MYGNYKTMLAVLIAFVVMAPATFCAQEFVYVGSDIQSANGNSIFAFQRAADGHLTAVPGSPFLTGGAGVQDSSLALGPYDSDQNVIVDQERKLLFAVNAGSDTVAVFHITSNGSLTAVKGSPFPSGGTNPVSVGISGNLLFVVNKNGDFPRLSPVLPNYAVFRVDSDGSLSQIREATISVALGSSPSQALVASGRNLLFGADFFGGLLQAFKIREDGHLTQRSPVALPDSEFENSPAPRLSLGLMTHPTLPYLYTGFVTINRLGVYRFDENGHLSFVRSVPNSGVAICWVRTNRSGRRLYTSNTGAFDTSTMSVYDSSDPARPHEIQTITLLGQGNVRQFELSKDGRFLFALTSRFSNLIPQGAGNALHILSIANDGTMSENIDPIVFNLPIGSEPQGVAVYVQQ